MFTRVRHYVSLLQFRHLIVPGVSAASASVAALGAAASDSSLREAAYALGGYDMIGRGMLATAGVTLLFAGGNIVNQINDIESDRINRPTRVLASDKLSVPEAAILAMGCWATGATLGILVRLNTWHAQLALLLVMMGCFLAYSIAPIRLKARGWLGNAVNAAVRGPLAFFIGWQSVAGEIAVEAMLLGIVFFLYYFGSSAVKDFVDVRGDRKDKAGTLPVRYGIDAAARMIAPFFYLPWLLALFGATRTLFGAGRDYVQAAPYPLLLWSVILCAYGYVISRIVRRDPEALTKTSRHPARLHTEYLSLLAALGLMACYLL